MRKGRRLDFFPDAAWLGPFPVNIEEVLSNVEPLLGHLGLHSVLADFCFWHKKEKIQQHLRYAHCGSPCNSLNF